MITRIDYPNQTVTSYGIRKLTTVECFRLMGVREDVIKTMQSTNKEVATKLTDYKFSSKKENEMAISRSQQYKQAGNSIVVNVLKMIYEQLWYPKEKEHDRLTSNSDETSLPLQPVDDNKGEKVFLTTFSGYDSQLMAADALKEDHPEFRWTCAGWSDIDKFACRMHNIVFPQFADKALGDITKIDWHKVKDDLNGREVDLFTYSSPCQDISQAGKQMGLKEGSGTRSALLWRVVDAVQVLKPKYLLQENVAALVSKKFMPDFQKWLDRLEELGYVNRWVRLNAKNYGVPQNRDRVFCLSMRKDVAFDYQFPEPIPLERKLADVLEEEVDERYFLNDDVLVKFLQANEKDSAVFMQFSLAPTHENAMFLKTWLHRFCDSHDLWNAEDHTQMVREIEDSRQNLMEDYDKFMSDRTSLGKEFLEKFTVNMERRQTV
jgi:DNA-cytosine methyltransferase